MYTICVAVDGAVCEVVGGVSVGVWSCFAAPNGGGQLASICDMWRDI